MGVKGCVPGMGKVIHWENKFCNCLLALWVSVMVPVGSNHKETKGWESLLMSPVRIDCGGTRQDEVERGGNRHILYVHHHQCHQHNYFPFITVTLVITTTITAIITSFFARPHICVSPSSTTQFLMLYLTSPLQQVTGAYCSSTMILQHLLYPRL